uniref:Amino acid transporter n=1 Tax=Panagrolaimus sp. JU765 TaxID=591449 RepID=A0AC34QN67_9BILA
MSSVDGNGPISANNSEEFVAGDKIDLSKEATIENGIEQRNGQREGSLKRNLGFFSSVGMIVGSIIGSGIFISPKDVVEETGSVGLSLLVWALAGIFVTLGSFVYIELGLLMSLSGGDYSYINEAFGSFAGFMRLWVEAIVIRPCTVTIVSLAFSEYVLTAAVGSADDLFLKLAITALVIILQTVINCISVKASVWTNNFSMVAKVGALIGIIGIGTVINCISVKASVWTNNFSMVAKVGALIGIIGIGVYAFAHDFGAASASFKSPFEGTIWNPGKIAVSFYSALFAYQGWNYLNFIIEEVKNPEKTLPRALIVSLTLVITIYVLCNVAFFTTLTPKQLIESTAAGIEFAEKNIQWDGIKTVVSVFVAISCFGSSNGCMLTASRLFFVGARNGHMPHCLLMTNPSLKTPIPSVLVTGILSLVYLALSNNAIQLIHYIAVSYWMAIGLATLSLFYFRIKRRKDPSYKTKYFILIPIVFFIGCVSLVVLPFYKDWKEALIGMGIVSSGLPFFIFVVWRPQCLQRLSLGTALVIQKIFLVVDDETTRQLEKQGSQAEISVSESAISGNNSILNTTKE